MSLSMERIDSRYVLRFKNRGQDAAVRALFVATPQATGYVCEWAAQRPLHPVVGKWIYGDSLPSEYDSHGCAPLTAGTYRIQAVGYGAGGILDVRIDAAGDVHAQ
jgi:hypothetical protein